MEIESNQSEIKKAISEEQKQQQKLLKKQKKKLKGQQKQELQIKQYGVKSVIIKDLSYEKKIFLLTDLIIDLDMFENEAIERPTKFDLISNWRPCIKIVNENNIVHIDLDTSADGLNNFNQVIKILQSMPNQSAYEISQYIQAYEKSLKLYDEKNNDLMYIYRLISQDQKSNYSLNDYFEDEVQSRLKIALQMVNEKYKQNKFFSYMIKIRRRNHQVIAKYGYSVELLNLLGIKNQNMYRLLYQNGPLLFFSNQDKLNRLKNSLMRRIEGLSYLKSQIEDLIYENQTILTFDDLKFNCNIHMIKTQLNNDQNYFIRNVIHIQLAVYDINDIIINEINHLRYKNAEESCNQTQIEFDDIYYGLDYQTQSEMFLQKFYKNEKGSQQVFK
ncbi:hypothetical protein ABPG72_007731 [Tetrahymena utriculariae]